MKVQMDVVIAILCVAIMHVHAVDSSSHYAHAQEKVGNFGTQDSLTGRQRGKRQSEDSRKHGYSPDDQRAIVKKHNEIRSQRNSSDMLKMEWDKGLELLAQGWADECSTSNRPMADRNTDKFTVVGENFYTSSIQITVEDIFNTWLVEKEDYHYPTANCTYYCERYKQMVWASTYAVGCGVAFCKEMEGFVNGAFRVVCNYGPGGNTPGVRPYKMGEPCSECPDYPYCLEKLCSKTPKHGSGSDMINQQSSLLLTALCLLLFSLEIKLAP